MLSTIEEALAELRKGRHIIVVDDEDRENEGDLILAAEKATPAAVNFMMVEGRGIICVAMASTALERLDLEPQARDNTSRHGTAYMISVDAASTSTGVSAHDRALTIRTLADPNARPDDLLRPGHIMPLRAGEGGVLRRAGHTEAAVDLARMAGMEPAGATCEIVNLDGTMSRMPQLEKFASAHGIVMITIADLIRYRLAREKLVERTAEVDLPTRFGQFRLYLYRNLLEGTHHLALVKGNLDPAVPVLVRVHSECLTGDVFHCLRCDCGEQLEWALGKIEQEGTGVLVYMLNHEGRGIGLANKVRAYSLQEKGLDTVEANRELGFPDDLRDYGQGAQILADLGVRRMRFMTNNPRKVVGLEAYGLSIEEMVPVQIKPNPLNKNYLKTKRDKLGHILNEF